MAEIALADPGSLLDAGAHERAVDFILGNGSELQHAQLAWYRTGDDSGISQALARYQNPNGGFGHGLEPDLRTERSSVVSTTVALQLLSRIAAPADSPLVAGALDYLSDTYDGANWRLIDAECNDAPQAPWWNWETRTDLHQPAGFVPNPGAEILSYFYTWPDGASDAMRDDLCSRAVANLESAIEMHDLLCYLRLLENPALPRPVSEALLPALLERAFELVEVNADAWNGYVLKPFDTVSAPDSPLVHFLGDSLHASIGWEIARQSDDGGWYPHWTWGDAYPATWKVVSVEIAVELTLRMLGKLRALGAIEST